MNDWRQILSWKVRTDLTLDEFLQEPLERTIWRVSTSPGTAFYIAVLRVDGKGEGTIVIGWHGKTLKLLHKKMKKPDWPFFITSVSSLTARFTFIDNF